MIKIKFTCNWTSDYEIKKRVESNFITEDNRNNDIIITDNNDYDFLFVFNKLNQKPLVPKNRIYTFIMEPSWSPNWDRNAHLYSNKVFCHDKSLFGNHENLIELPSFMFYHMNFNKHNIKKLLNENPKKTKRISMVVSYTPHNHNFNYSKRTELAIALLEKNIDIDIFGNGWDFTKHKNIKGPVMDKWDGLCDYKFSVAIENSCQKNYITEKFFDITLCGGVPIYYGCPNVSEIYKNLIPIDLNDIPKTIEIINDVSNTDKYDFMLNSVLSDKITYYTNYNLYNKIVDLVTTSNTFNKSIV
jgi:hypothetical protein